MGKEETELETAGSTKTREMLIFEELPVPKAVISMVLPAIISQIIFVIYNLADTWYVGLTENANAVAAISLCLPVYTLMTGISNLFGIGGDSVIARALGAGRKEKARQTFAVSVWSALLTAVIYACIMFFAGRDILLLIGGDSGDIDYAVSYTFRTIVIGGAPTVLTATLGHLVRAAGYSRQASFGIILGAVLNLIFDPLFMFVLLPKGNEVMGAAMATALSNFFAMFYFIGFILKNRASGLYALNPFAEKAVGVNFAEIIKCGLPGFCMIALAMLSNCFLNSMLSTLGNGAVAGVGIVRKIDRLAYAVNQGLSMLLLFILHHIMNPAWLKTLFKGRYTPYRVYNTAINVLLLAIMMLLPISGIMMSKHIFHFFGVGGMSFARTVHLLLSHWGFILMSVHVGNHAGAHRAGKKKGFATLLWTAAIAVSIYGAYAFVTRDMTSYLFLKNQFVFFDFGQSRLRFLMDYAAMMCLFACIGTVLSRGLKKLQLHKHENSKVDK